VTSYNCWICTEVCEEHYIFVFRLEENPKQNGGEASQVLGNVPRGGKHRGRTRILDSSPRQTTSLFNRAEQFSKFKSEKIKIIRRHQRSSVFPKIEINPHYVSSVTDFFLREKATWTTRYGHSSAL